MANTVVPNLATQIKQRVSEIVSSGRRVSVRAACAEICSPTTLYDFDKSAPKRQRLVPFIKTARAEQKAASAGRRRSARPIDERVPKLEAEAAAWRAKYECALEKLTLLELACRGSSIDVSGIYRDGLVKPDRSMNRSGKKRTTDGTTTRVPVALF